MKRISLVVVILALGLSACNNDNQSTQNEEQNAKQPEQFEGNGTPPSDQAIDPSNINNPISGNQENTQQNTGELPVLTFEHDLYEFPQSIKEGESVPHSFRFTNTGKSDLIITDASAPCGCTIPSFSKEPIAPGKSGKIDVIFNSEGKPGRNEKAVIVTSNSIPNTKELRFIINVTPKQQ